jgi:thiamine pyrophosphokinase
MPRAIVFANGLLPDISNELHHGDTNPICRFIGPADLLIAADGGTRHALSLGLTPSFIIGDLDSLTMDDSRWINEKGVRLIQFPADKNETDLELAIHFAVEQGCSEIVIVAALGGRLDQTLGNLSLLNAPDLAAVDIRLDDGVEEVFLTSGTCKIFGKPGDLVSLLPWGGDVTGVSTEGLRWVLQSETLHQHKTRGISNELLGDIASIKISSGSLLVVHRRSI